YDAAGTASDEPNPRHRSPDGKPGASTPRLRGPFLSEHSIGVFDSGVGGLSVLRSLRMELPREDFIYVADGAHAPYGERDDQYLVERARTITHHLLVRHQIKALVIACNTATAAAIQRLRQEHPGLPIVGVEPALKPAAAASATHRIGVMATRSTLASAKYRALLTALQGQAEFISQACDGLAQAIEHHDTTKIIALCAQYTGQIGQFGSEPGQIDSLVLGCTHYAFADAELRALVGPAVRILDTGEPVAKRTRQVLASRLAQRADPGQCQFETSGAPTLLQTAIQRWLQLAGPVGALPV
ncbi:MAG: glutamate racemase, partial [Pseudomonadota bacterium]